MRPDHRPADWGNLRKRCPHCGALGATLGTVCPNCGKTYVPRTLWDRVPLGGDPPYLDRLILVVALWLIAGFIWLAITHPVAAAVVFGLGFVLLVAAVALNNWLATRG
jgi:hypothetical protein